MLKDRQDTYGHQLYDCFKGREVVEVVERNDGYVDPSHSLPRAYLSDYKDWPSFERKAMQYARGRVLDIGSGGGRCSLYLQKNGFEVVGIDNSPLAVKVCKLRGLKNVRVMSISDVSPQLGQFDTILMIGNNFGLFGGFKQARKLLRRFHSLTSAEALIIAETNDPYKTSEPFHLAYHRLSRRRGRMPGQLKIRVRYKRYVTPWFDYLIVSKREMKKILQGTGWKVKRFIDSTGSVYIAIIEKVAK